MAQNANSTIAIAILTKRSAQTSDKAEVVGVGRNTGTNQSMTAQTGPYGWKSSVIFAMSYKNSWVKNAKITYKHFIIVGKPTFVRSKANEYAINGNL